MAYTLQELSVKYAKKQTGEVDDLLEDNPVLASLPFKASTHAMHNVYQKLEAVTGASFVAGGKALPNMSTKSKLERVDLGIMGGQMEVDQDTVKQYGGLDLYLNDRLPDILKATGTSAEQSIIYNFWYQYCLNNKTTHCTNAGATTGDSYIMLAVRYSQRDNVGLFSPEGFADGVLFPWEWYNGQSVYKDASGVNVYGGYIKNYFGWQLASDKVVQAIVNINASNLPTDDEISASLRKVRADGSTQLVMTPALMDLLGNEFKDNIYYQPTDRGIDKRIASYNGVPILSTFNMSEDEDIVSFA
jgi:hypothetical protein